MTNKPSVLIQAEHIKKIITSGEQPLTILSDINLTITKGQSIAILGPSGSGKTTLLSLLSALDVPSSGRITFNDKIISDMSEDERALLRKQHIGIIFQTFQLLPAFTAFENVLLPLELSGVSQAKKIAHDWLTRVGLQHRENHYPSQLSGGEQQRVAIARAFAISPKVLFADEPTGNLDQKTSKQVETLLLQLNREQQLTLIVVTHDQSFADQCDNQYYLQEGTLQ